MTELHFVLIVIGIGAAAIQVCYAIHQSEKRICKVILDVAKIVAEKMKAIILAAGKGVRLASLDLVVPKPMVRVGGIPVLEDTITHMDNLGIRDITITVGSMKDTVMNYFGDGRAFGVRIRYSIEDEHNLLGTAGGVKRAAEDWIVDEPFVVWHGDNFSNCRIDRMSHSHVVKNADCTLVVRWRDDVSHSGVVEWLWNNRVSAFTEKPQDRLGGGWINSGIYMMNPSIIEILPERGDLGRDVFPVLITANRRLFVHGLSHDEIFRWYDTPEDLAELRKDYR